jgi:hypothetical protein
VRAEGRAMTGARGFVKTDSTEIVID